MLRHLYIFGLIGIASVVQAKTLRELIMASGPNEVQTAIGAKCSEGIREYFSAGNSFFNQPVFEASTAIAAFSFLSGKKSSIFYHYTSSTPWIALARLNQVDQEFDYLRKSGAPGLYVAEDPFSSRTYGGTGNSQIRIVMNPKARIIGGDYAILIDQMKRTLPDQIRGFCKAKGFFSDLVLEENRVALIDYFMDENTSTWSHEWFLLVSPKEVESIATGVPGQW